MEYIKIEPNSILKHYVNMSAKEIESHINNMAENRYICAFELCKVPMIVSAFRSNCKKVCYFRAKNSHKIGCKWVIQAQGSNKIMIGTEKENESMQRALLSLLKNDDDLKVDFININNGEIEKKTNYRIKNESSYVGVKISRVKKLPSDYNDLVKNTKYKFLKEVSIKRHLTYNDKTIFYINNIFANEKISLEIRETSGYYFDLLIEYFKKIPNGITRVELAIVFVFEGIEQYLTEGKSGGKISLWKKNSCALKVYPIKY